MNRTSLVVALVVPSLLLACGAGVNTVGEEWPPDAGNPPDTSPPSDTCPGCTAGAAKLVLSAPEICLSAPVGQQSRAASFDVSNIGTAASGPLTAALSGPAAASFIITSNTCSAALPPAGTCQVTVAYAPAAAHANAESATLTVADAQTSVAALLRGSDIGTVTVSPATLTFGEVTAGNSSDELFVRVTTTSYCENTWTAALDNPNFVISSNTCTGPMTNPCQIGVRFAPPAGAAPSPVTGQLSVLASDSGSATVALSGVVAASKLTAGPLKVSPATVDFGDVIFGESATASIGVSGAKSAPMAVLAGPEADQFIIIANTCTTAGETCAFQIRFTPTAAGPSSATLTVNDGESTVTVSLVGRGVMPPGKLPFAVSPATLDFGRVSVSTTSAPMAVTVTSTSPRTLIASLSGSAGEVTIVSNTCGPLTLTSGTCTIGLTYTPAKVSKLNGTLNISDGTTVVPVILAGEGWTLL